MDQAPADIEGAILTTAYKYLGPGGIIVLATLFVLSKLGLLGKKSNGDTPPRQEPITGPQLVGVGRTADYTAEAQMLRDLGRLEYQFEELEKRVTAYEKRLLKIEQQTRTGPIKTAVLVSKILREEGILPTERPSHLKALPFVDETEFAELIDAPDGGDGKGNGS